MFSDQIVVQTVAPVGSYQSDCPIQSTIKNSLGSGPLSLCISVSRDASTPHSVGNRDINTHMYRLTQKHKQGEQDVSKSCRVSIK